MSDQPGAVAEDLPLKRGIDDVTAVEGEQAQAEAGAAETPPVAAGADEEPKGQADTSSDSAAGVEAMVTESADDADRFTVVVNFKKQKLEISVRPSDLVSDIKTKLEDMTGVEKANQKLMFKGMLQDASTTEAAGLKEGAKLMLIGTATQEIRMEALAAVVSASIQPAAGAGAAPKKGERLQDQTEHKKVIEKGVPPGADKGQSGRKMRLYETNNVINNLWDKRGEAVRLTFKLEDNQLWIGAKTRTTKLNLDQIRSVTWESIAGHDGYCILVLQAGPTAKSNLMFYFVPAQYCDDIRRCIMS